MNYSFEEKIEMDGMLTTLGSSEIVEVPYIKLDKRSTKKLEILIHQ